MSEALQDTEVGDLRWKICETSVPGLAYIRWGEPPAGRDDRATDESGIGPCRFP